MKKTLFSLALVLSSFAWGQQKTTYVQRCLEGEDMAVMIARLEGQIPAIDQANSVRISAINETGQIALKFEFFSDKECTTPFLTNEAVYKDGVVAGRIVYHLRMGHTVTCHSEKAKAEYKSVAKSFEKSPTHTWDGKTFKEDLSGLPEKGRHTRVIAGPAAVQDALILLVAPLPESKKEFVPVKGEEFRPVR